MDITKSTHYKRIRETLMQQLNFLLDLYLGILTKDEIMEKYKIKNKKNFYDKKIYARIIHHKLIDHPILGVSPKDLENI